MGSLSGPVLAAKLDVENIESAIVNCCHENHQFWGSCRLVAWTKAGPILQKPLRNPSFFGKNLSARPVDRLTPYPCWRYYFRRSGMTTLRTRSRSSFGSGFSGSSWPWVVFNTASAKLGVSDPTCEYLIWKGTLSWCFHHVTKKIWSFHAFQMQVLNGCTNFSFLLFSLNLWSLLI